MVMLMYSDYNDVIERMNEFAPFALTVLTIPQSPTHCW